LLNKKSDLKNPTRARYKMTVKKMLIVIALPLILASCGTEPFEEGSCEFVDCSEHGICIENDLDNEALCFCDSGFVRSEDGLDCIEVTSCDPNPCVEENRGICEEVDGETVCSCDDGFVLEDNVCVEDEGGDGDDEDDEDDEDKEIENLCDPNPCKEGDLTRCVVQPDGKSYKCECELGFEEKDGTCVVDPDPCEPNPCVEPNRTQCRVLGEETLCKCDLGYALNDNDMCVQLGEVEWVVMVFLNADNNLNPQGTADIKEMLATVLPRDVVVTVQYDGLKDDDTQRAFITVDGSTVIERIGERDMGNPDEVVEFVKWSVDSFPARHYMLDIWNHGDGWSKKKIVLDEEPEPEWWEPAWKGVSADDHGGVISIAGGGLESALVEAKEHIGRNLDILAFDACLMQMWEVNYVSAPYVDYMLASEETEPGSGYNYTLFLNGLIEDPYISPEGLCSHGADAYKEASSQHSTQSCINLAHTAELTAAMEALAAKVMSDMKSVDLAPVINATQGFMGAGHKDLYHLAENLEAHQAATSGVKAAAQDLKDVLDNKSIVNSIAQGRCAMMSSCDNANGLAVYIPATIGNQFNLYKNGAGANWSKETKWDEFIEFVAK